MKVVKIRQCMVSRQFLNEKFVIIIMFSSFVSFVLVRTSFAFKICTDGRECIRSIVRDSPNNILYKHLNNCSNFINQAHNEDNVFLKVVSKLNSIINGGQCKHKMTEDMKRHVMGIHRLKNYCLLLCRNYHLRKRGISNILIFNSPVIRSKRYSSFIPLHVNNNVLVARDIVNIRSHHKNKVPMKALNLRLEMKQKQEEKNEMKNVSKIRDNVHNSNLSKETLTPNYNSKEDSRNNIIPQSNLVLSRHPLENFPSSQQISSNVHIEQNIFIQPSVSLHTNSITTKFYNVLPARTGVLKPLVNSTIYGLPSKRNYSRSPLEVPVGPEDSGGHTGFINIVFRSDVVTCQRRLIHGLKDATIYCNCHDDYDGSKVDSSNTSEPRILNQQWLNIFKDNMDMICYTNRHWLTFDPPNYRAIWELVLAFLYVVVIVFGTIGNFLSVYAFSR